MYTRVIAIVKTMDSLTQERFRMENKSIFIVKTSSKFICGTKTK